MHITHTSPDHTSSLEEWAATQMRRCFLIPLLSILITLVKCSGLTLSVDWNNSSDHDNMTHFVQFSWYPDDSITRLSVAELRAGYNYSSPVAGVLWQQRWWYCDTRPDLGHPPHVTTWVGGGIICQYSVQDMYPALQKPLTHLYPKKWRIYWLHK